jgi:type II secretory pathway component PulJ
MAWYNEQSGFSLLEAVLVVGLVAMITIALGNFIIEQFDSWEVGTNQITSYDNNDLFITYLERDRKRAIAAYRNDDDQWRC